MNFYKHHIGDYDQATRHLSFVEDAAYSRLIRKYYAEERPLPAEVKQVQRLIGARTRDEKEAVETILGEFFVLEADGWHNKRCDEEIGQANKQAEVNRRIALEREAKKRERQNNEASTKRDLFEHEAWSGHKHESCSSREPSQTPDTRHQIKPTEPIGSAADAAPSDPKVMIFSLGVRLLVGAGSSDTAARSFLGKHAKGDEAKLAEVIGYLAANPKIEPKAYIAAAMAPKKPELAL